MREVVAVIYKSGSPALWFVPQDASPVATPDSPTLWDFIWRNRLAIAGVAHSHPGHGVPVPSHTDLTTFAAIEAGLGTRLTWWITSADRMVRVRWSDGTYLPVALHPLEEPRWVRKLRALSGCTNPPPHVGDELDSNNNKEDVNHGSS